MERITSYEVKNWYNYEIAQRKIDEFAKKHHPLSVEKLIIMSRDIKDKEDFRCLCTFMEASKYDTYNGINFSYAESSVIIKNLNAKVDEILCEYAELYKQLMKAQKREQWGGDTKYTLFAYGIPAYEEACVILSLVELVANYINQPLKVEDMDRISKLYIHGRLNSLYEEPMDYLRDWEHDPKLFKELNNARKTHIERWSLLSSHLWNRDYKSAFALLQKGDKEAEIQRQKDRELSKKKYGR